MNKMKKYLVFLVLMAAVFMSKSVLAETLTVSKSGNADFASIQAAVDAAVPGDTIIVGKGVYYETVTITKKGTADKPITLRAESNNLGDVIVTATTEEIRTGKRKWTLLEGTEDVYYIDWDTMVGSVTVDDMFFVHTLSLEQLKTREYDSRCIGFPTLGFYWADAEKRLYIRLHERYFDNLDPNAHTVCVGGEMFQYTDPVAQVGNGAYQSIRKNTNCYNMAVWTEGPTYVNIEGFTFEVPGTCGLYVRGDNVNVRNCYFRGCRIGVYGGVSHYYEGIITKDVVVEHCDFTQYPTMYDDACYNKELHWENPEIAEREKEPNYYWGAKNKVVRMDYETAAFINGAGYNWEVCNNYTWETFEPLGQRFHVTGMEYIEEEGETYRVWMSGSNHKIHHNRFEKSVDNVLELENHATEIEFYNNECIDVLNAISWQPGDGEPLPKNCYIHNNLFYNSEENVKYWGGGSPFKMGHKKESYDAIRYLKVGRWRQPNQSTVINKHWFVDDKGIQIYNNTMVMPEGQVLANMGSWDSDNRYTGKLGGFGTGLNFSNNLFYAKMRTEESADTPGKQVGFFMTETYSIEQYSNMFIPGDPTGPEFKQDTKWLETGKAFRTFEEAGLKLVEKDGMKIIEIADSNSPAVSGGTQVELSVEDTPYIGAVPYGEEWIVRYGVYPYGDTNYDRVINEYDVFELSSRLGGVKGDDKFVNVCDLDFNGEVDGNDLQLLNDLMAGGAFNE